jgi:hypothetical protein
MISLLQLMTISCSQVGYPYELNIGSGCYRTRSGVGLAQVPEH